MIYSDSDIAGFEQRYRAVFINSVLGFKNLNLVGTISPQGISNLAVFNSIFHIGANPPCVGMVVRPDGPEHDTLNNILEVKQYTLNNITGDFYKQAHQTSARYPSGESEFNRVGLEKEYIADFTAPFVKSSTIKMGLELREFIPVELNGTYIIIGEILYIKLDQALVEDDGFVNIEEAGTLTCSGLDSYHKTSRISRLSYAKPGKHPEEISVKNIHH